MNPLHTIAVGLLLLSAAPSFAQPNAPDRDTVVEAGEPRGERWDERWQGRRHWLYDDASDEGQNANARATCSMVPVRVKRPDGAVTIRWQRRCE